MYYYAVMATTIFSRKEIEYLKSQRLARIATAAMSSSDERGSIQPYVVPVGFDYDGNYFYWDLKLIYIK